MDNTFNQNLPYTGIFHQVGPLDSYHVMSICEFDPQ